MSKFSSIHAIVFDLQTLSKFGRIDVLVNNHGINPVFGDILDVEDSMWDKLFETNVKAGWQLCKLVVPHMKKQR